MTFESILAHLPTILPSLSVLGELSVVFFLVQRKVWRNLPVFSLYVIWALLSDITLNLLERTQPFNTFFRFYIAETLVDSIFFFAVLVELAWSVLRPIRASLPSKSLYILAALIAIAAGVTWPLVVNIMAIPPKFGPDSARLFHLNETVAILRVGCFLVLASFSQLLSIGWRDRELQIATGFGFFSIISLIVAVLHSHPMPQEQYSLLDQVVAASYLGTLSYWVLSFSKKEQKRRDFTPQMRELLLLMSGGARVARIDHTDSRSKRSRKKEK